MVAGNPGGKRASMRAELFGVEASCLAEDEGNPVLEPFVVVGRHHVDVPRSRECAFWRIRQNGENGRRADDVELVDIEATSSAVNSAVSGDSWRIASDCSDASVMARRSLGSGPSSRASQRSRASGRGAAFDGYPAVGPGAIEDAPERWLADARSHHVPDARLRKRERLAHRTLQPIVFHTFLYFFWISTEQITIVRCPLRKVPSPWSCKSQGCARGPSSQ
jgi:hypothetical protein